MPGEEQVGSLGFDFFGELSEEMTAAGLNRINSAGEESNKMPKKRKKKRWTSGSCQAVPGD